MPEQTHLGLARTDAASLELFSQITATRQYHLNDSATMGNNSLEGAIRAAVLQVREPGVPSSYQ